MIQENQFFIIPKDEVLAVLAPETVNFYQRAKYLDLTSGDLHVSTDLLRSNWKLLDNIDYEEGRRIVQEHNLQLPSVALMYLVIIPYLKRHQSDKKLGNVLRSMNHNCEFLEDVVIQNDGIEESSDSAYGLKLKVGNRKTALLLPHKIEEEAGKFWNYEVSGSFSLEDLNDLGFPTALKDKGEFMYWGPNDFNRFVGKELYPYGGGPQGQVATIRSFGQTLDLNLIFRPSNDIQDNLGVRGLKVT